MQTIKKVIGNAMIPINEIKSGEAPVIINLTDVYRIGRRNPLFFFWSHFVELVTEATQGGKYPIVELDNEIFFEFENKFEGQKSLNDRQAMIDLQEEMINLTTGSGRLEARKRLGMVAVLLQNGNLPLNENTINIGWFLFSSGNIRRAGFGWRYNKWNFGSNDIINNPRSVVGWRYWSRNTI